MIVVLDTNIWIKELALQSNLGSATRLYLRQQGATVALPEVIELETKHNLNEHIENCIIGMKRHHRDLVSLLGELEELLLPEDRNIKELVRSVFDQLGVEVERLPFNMGSAQGSFLRTIDGTPPCGKHNQQFKDGVIWEECLNLLDKDDVVFVSEDKAFFAKDGNKDNLAPELEKETRGKSHKLRIFKSLGDFLPQIKEYINVEDDTLVEHYSSNISDAIQEVLDEHDLVITRTDDVEKKLHATENPDSLFVTFTLHLECEDISDDQRSASLLVEGNTVYHPSAGILSGFEYKKEKLVVYDSERNQVDERSATYLGRLRISTSGNKMIRHEVRYPLDEPE